MAINIESHAITVGYYDLANRLIWRRGWLAENNLRICSIGVMTICYSMALFSICPVGNRLINSS